MLCLHRFRCRIAEHRHHVEKVFERAIAVLAGAEHFADAIAERIDAQLGILEYLVHRQFGVLVVAHLLGSELLEFLVRPVRNYAEILARNVAQMFGKHVQ